MQKGAPQSSLPNVPLPPKAPFIPADEITGAGELDECRADTGGSESNALAEADPPQPPPVTEPSYLEIREEVEPGLGGEACPVVEANPPQPPPMESDLNLSQGVRVGSKKVKE